MKWYRNTLGRERILAQKQEGDAETALTASRRQSEASPRSDALRLAFEKAYGALQVAREYLAEIDGEVKRLITHPRGRNRR